MKKTFYIIFAISGVATLFSFTLLQAIGGDWLVAIAAACGTTFYHFAMRLAVGYAVRAGFPKMVNYRNFWFREHQWESRFYRALRLRRYAGRIPTFDPDEFDTAKHTPKELLRQTCLSEVVHEVIIFLGYGSLFFCFFFSDPLANLPIFLITAFFAGLYDLQFVILQRVNRPRLLRHIELQEKKAEAEKIKNKE